MTDIMARILRGRVAGQQYPDITPACSERKGYYHREIPANAVLVYNYICDVWRRERRGVGKAETARALGKQHAHIDVALGTAERYGLLLYEDDQGRVYPWEVEG